MLAYGCGMNFLAYYCATHFKTLNVINGGEKGSCIQSIDQLDPDFIQRITQKEVFLDNATGDYYSFQHVCQNKIKKS
jgi:hypothetical protein